MDVTPTQLIDSVAPLGVVTLEALAERWNGVGVERLRRWARSGRLPAKKCGKVWLISEAELANWFERLQGARNDKH